MKCELPAVQSGFSKGRGTRDKIDNIHWIIEKERSKRVPEKHIHLLHRVSPNFDCVDHNKLWGILKDGNTRAPHLPPEKSVCRSRSNS